MRRFFAAAAVFLTGSLVVTLAQQPQPTQPQEQKPQTAQPPAQGRGGAGQGRGNAAPGKPIVPVAVSTLMANPDPYLGEYISLTAPVEAPLTKTAFSVDQDKTKPEKELLVVAPTMTGTVEANAYVTVLGTLVKFDPDDIAKKTKNYTLDLPADAVAKYKGKLAIVATAVVVNATGVDIAKVLPPPMTPDELELQKIMKAVGPANTALRAAIDKMDVAAVKEQVAILSPAFTKTEAFWKTKNKAEAVTFAADAKKHSDAIGAAVASGNWDAAKAAATPLGAQCAGCHGAFRERMDDGTFRIKTTGSR